jgi:hypothetical protein
LQTNLGALETENRAEIGGSTNEAKTGDAIIIFVSSNICGIYSLGHNTWFNTPGLCKVGEE